MGEVIAFDYESLIRVDHDNRENAIKGRSFNILLLFFLIALVIVIISMAIHSIINSDSSYGFPTIINSSLVIFTILFCYYLTLKGKVVPAVHIFLIIIIIGISSATITRGDSNTIILLFPFTIIVSGLFLGPRSSFVYAVMSMIAYGLAELYLHSQGTILVLHDETMILNNYLAVVASLLVVAIATWLFTRNLQNYISTLEKQDKEKEILLREIHHRVKNNLQIVSSMLNLQQDALTDKESKIALQESVSRVKSMALIHERLYMSSDLSSINIHDYIGSLLGHINQSQIESVPDLEIQQDIQKIELDVDVSLSLGLIINELVTNSLKHGFPPGHTVKNPVIMISLKKEVNDVLILKISDNGKGLPDNFDYRNSESLGLQLVETLIEELEGKLEIKNGHGSNFIIAFKNEARL